MKLSDLFIRGRQLFGFLLPGGIWLISIALLCGVDVLGLLEKGSGALRVAGFLALSYITGFCLQTLLFTAVADTMKRRMGIPKTVAGLVEQIKRLISERQPLGMKELLIADKHIPVFCKWYVLENSSELRNLLSELEVDINFLVANTVPLPLLAFAILYYLGVTPLALGGGTVAAAAVSALLLLRLKFYLRREVEKWCQMFWVLQIRAGDGEDAAP